MMSKRRMAWLAPLVVTAAMAILPPSARAQDLPEPTGSSSSGRPLDGYFATALLAAGALFVVGKSARR
jgi:hypothetical protein